MSKTTNEAAQKPRSLDGLVRPIAVIEVKFLGNWIPTHEVREGRAESACILKFNGPVELRINYDV